MWVNVYCVEDLFDCGWYARKHAGDQRVHYVGK